jgi:hypothetical protein
VQQDPITGQTARIDPDATTIGSRGSIGLGLTSSQSRSRKDSFDDVADTFIHGFYRGEAAAGDAIEPAVSLGSYQYELTVTPRSARLVPVTLMP